MHPFEDRYTRQRQLPEVGLAGQERLEALSIALADDPAGAIAAVYLTRAGVPCRRTPANSGGEAKAGSAGFPHQEHFRHALPAEFAHGCQQALGHIRAALRVGGGGS